MDIRLLGPLEVSADNGPAVLGGVKQRALLAMLALEANRTVTADRLMEGLWGEHPPPSAGKMIQHYVSRLRKVLAATGGTRIVTRGRGYELRVDPDAVDARRFERLVAEAARTAEAGAAREALALWRGAALADLADEPFAAAEIRRLEELRETAAELAIEADLAAGRHREVVGEIEALVAEHRLRERLHAQRMLALYRSGRQAEALEAFREARRTLVDEIGVEPGPELQRLHEAILRQDVSLDLAPAAPELPRELDAAAAPPLVGRDDELSWLRERWERARIGAGALVEVVGGDGMGKTRIAAELAGEAHRDGAAVLYVAGGGPAQRAEAVLSAVARGRDARRPTLLVVDDADRSGADVLAALGELTRGLAGAPVLALASGRDASALARLGGELSLTLEPLDAEAVRRIAALYAAGDVPIERLLESSRGVPRRVHEAASEWARRRAARRVDAVAGRAAAGRGQLRSIEAELAGGVVELQSARERAELVTARDTDGGEEAVVCPFKGLAPFDVDDAAYFFGRERLVAELVARLVGAPLLGVIGPSGSGKSSVLRAGLLPALAGGVVPGSEDWAQILIRPGEHPRRELRRAAASLGADRRVVLAVDQFEEMFTVCRDEEQRAGFVDALVRAARDHARRGVVVLALRADFYGRCSAYPELSSLLGANQVLVGAMRRDELRRAIEQPAQRAGLRAEPELVDALVRDVEGEPGALPLLSTALLELWRRRDGRRLRLAAYERTGGVRGAVARLAEDAYGRLDPAQQTVARGVLLRLAGEGEGGAVVRRRVPLTELEAQRSEDVARVVAVLTDARLLTVSAGTVEVAHEALLREWPRLRGWLEEDAQGRRLHHHLIHAARDWGEGGRERAELYRGARLASALEWRAGHEHELNASEREFLDASRAASEHAQRRVRAVLAGVAALLLVAVIAGLVALDQRGNARDEARVAEAQRLGAQALTEDALDRSLLLARQGVALDDSLTTRDNLLAALLRAPAAIGVLRGDGGRLLSVGVHPNGAIVAAGDNRGRLLVFDAVTRRRLRPPYETGLPIQAVRFSPDGTRLALASGDETGAVLDLLDAGSFRRIARHELGALAAPPDNLAFSPDSRRLLASYTPALPPQGAAGPGYLARWDARTGRRVGRPTRVTRKGPFMVAFAAGGTRLVTMSAVERETVIRDADTPRPLRRLRGAGLTYASAVSADGRVAALAGEDGSLRLLDLRTGKARTASGRHEAPINQAVFTPEARTLVTVGDDAKLIVWDVLRASAKETFEGHAARISEVALAPDARTAYSASADGTVIAWDLAGERRLGRPFRAGSWNEGAGYNVAATPDGGTLAVPQRDGSVNLIDTRTLARTGRIRATHGAPAIGIAFAPDGRTMAVTATDGTLGFWDARTRARLGAPVRAVKNGMAWSPRFSGDGRWLATAGLDSVVRLWDPRRRIQVRTLRLKSLPRDIALRPDGKILAVPATNGRGDGAVEILSVPGLKRIGRIPMAWARWSRFSADGRLLVLGDHEGRARVYDGRTFKPRGRPLLGHAGVLLTADFSPDDRTLATTSSDGTTRLWDVASSRPIGTPLPGVAGLGAGAHFVRAGTHLVVVYDSGQAYLWDVRPSSWMRRACAVAGRTLTRTEWEDVLPQRDFAPACARG